MQVKSVPILGLKALTQLNLVQRINAIHINTKQKPNLLDNYKDVFQGVGQLPGEYSIKLKENAEPVVYPVRRVPESIKLKLKESLDNMVKNKIITPVDEPTDWVHSLVIVEKLDGSLRVCLDPRN